MTEALGTTSDAVVDDVVSRAGGNALHLEELVRSVVETGATLASTPGEMLAHRLSRLGVNERRVLGVASTLGDSFWVAAVAEALGHQIDANAIDRAIEELVRAELIAPVEHSRFVGQRELRFRHSLVQRAAYESTPESERALGHARAAAWLQKVGGAAPAELAQHRELAGDGGRVASLWERAASLAFRANDYPQTVELVERALASGTDGPARGRLRLWQAEAQLWIGSATGRLEAALDAERCLADQAELPLALAHLVSCHLLLDQPHIANDAVERLLALAATDDVSPHLLRALASSANRSLLSDRDADARRLIERYDALASRCAEPAPFAQAERQWQSALRAMRGGDMSIFLESVTALIGILDDAGDVRRAVDFSPNVGYAFNCLGAYERAATWLEETRSRAERLGLEVARGLALNNLGKARLGLGELDEAVTAERTAVAAFEALGDRRLEAGSRDKLAEILLERGELGEAHLQAERAVALAEAAAPALLANALATLAFVELGRGDRDSALAHAERAVSRLTGGPIEEGESHIRLAFAECAYAHGRADDAREALRVAWRRVEQGTNRISDPALAQSFWTRHLTHVRIARRASQWAEE